MVTNYICTVQGCPIYSPHLILTTTLQWILFSFYRWRTVAERLFFGSQVLKLSQLCPQLWFRVEGQALLLELSM